MSKPCKIVERPLQEYNRLTNEQLAAVKKLVKKCCNYSQGFCTALDEGDDCPCVQSFSYSLICKWFRNAVLPMDPVLERKLRNEALKKCERCGKEIAATSNHTKYCASCKRIRRQELDAERKRKQRGTNVRF